MSPKYTRINNLFEGGMQTGLQHRPVYHSYRIPSIVSVGEDIILAFAEGRVKSSGDWGDIDIVLRRSLDNGKTWEPMQQLFGTWNTNAWTNPTAVYEEPWPGRPEGRVHLFFNNNDGDLDDILKVYNGQRRTYYAYSDTRGSTWSTSKDLTDYLLPPDFTWDAVGPGTGIHKRFYPYSDYLIVPATGRNFVSRDHGESWTYERVPANGTVMTGESAIVEREDGALCRFDRTNQLHWQYAERRWVACGTDLSAFPAPMPEDSLLDPKMQASVLRAGRASGREGQILFLNSESTKSRSKMRVKVSKDGGSTWPCGRYLYVDTPPDWLESMKDLKTAGKGGYSSMSNTVDGYIAVLSEVNPCGDEDEDHRSLDFHKFNLDWVYKKCDTSQPSDTSPLLH